MREILLTYKWCFRINGDILEIFPPYDDVSIRIELFGNTVERISKVDQFQKKNN